MSTFYTRYPTTGGGGSVTSVDVSGGTTGLTTSGGPITTSGTITLAGTVNIANGGTGHTTASAAFDALSPATTKGDLIAYSTTNARLAVGSNGQALIADSAQTTGVKWGTLAIGGGGTGQVTANAAFAALSPMTTAGDIIYENNTPLPARLAVGSTGQVLTVAAGLPSWATPAPLPTTATFWGDQSIVSSGVAISYESDINQIYGQYVQNPAVTGDTFSYDFNLQAGTYTFTVLGNTNTNRGMCTWSIDNVAFITNQDWYDTGFHYNVYKTGTATVTSGNHTLKCVNTGKNVASADQFLVFSKFYFHL